MTDPLILGIDGGGSKVLVWLADSSGKIVRAARGAGVNPMDNAGWRRELEAQLAPMLHVPGLAGVAAALPAYGEVEHLSRLQDEVISQAFDHLPHRVLNDVEAAHFGAFAGAPGILILSGTGSMAWASDHNGQSYRVGGWGDVIGDEGSSYWIGRRALSLISKSLDGRQAQGLLADLVFDHLGLGQTDALGALTAWSVGLANPRAEIASLATLVNQAAELGDPSAVTLIEESAAELASHIETIARLSRQDPIWTYAGGTFNSRLLLEALTAQVGHPPVPSRLPPIGGALLAAAQLVGWPADNVWIERVAAAADGSGNIGRSDTPELENHD